MDKNVKKVKNIIHIVCLRVAGEGCNRTPPIGGFALSPALRARFTEYTGGIGLIFWGILFNFVCVYCHKYTAFSQFVDATAAGFVITSFVLCIGICTSEETERQTEMTIAYMGGIFYTLSVIFLCLEYNDVARSDGLRMIFAIVFGILLAAAYFIEAIFATVKKEMVETEV